jgi:hypothetical protein
LNHTDLNDNAKAVDTINADVAGNTSVINPPRYTYISLYILLTGKDENTLTWVYSKPTFIGILKLPDPN